MEEPEASPRLRVTGPSGMEFDLVGRAAPVRLRRAPGIAAEAGQELMTVKEGSVFVCSQWDGDIQPGLSSGGGLYRDDTRYLSELRLRIGGKPAVLLSSSAALGYEAVVDLTNPTLGKGPTAAVAQMTLNIRRRRVVQDRCFERIEVRNHGHSRAETELGIALSADFADVFEVRGMRRRIARGRALAPRQGPGEVRFAYIGEDELFLETIVEIAPEPDEAMVSNDGADLRWKVVLEPHESFEIDLAIEPSPHGFRGSRTTFEGATRRAKASADRWRRQCTDVRSTHPTFNQFLAASVRDLHLLDTPADGGRIVAAGIPWYVAPFGRDALLACYEAMSLTCEPARNTLRYLARFQSGGDDPLRDAEPGKILHEKRAGELARAGAIPHVPYYGSVDSTPLFLMLGAAYYRWTADLELMDELRTSFDSALAWIDRHGDLDGDGFVEYRRRCPAGLDNQGWKDSEDSVIHVDGTRAEPPIALAEVQGYVYLAKQRIADVYEALGAPETAEALRTEAKRLREDFNQAFWMPDEGFFAMALDGHKRQVRSVTSNPGHCLYCGMIDPAKADAVAERLMAMDMFSGWGIRTLSAEHRAYNPMSYHDGSVWPHDNAIIAAGLKRYGFSQATDRIATALFDVAVEQRDFRLPELFCGFARRPGVPVVGYPVACRPQAWAAAAPFMLVQSMLGLSARAPEGILAVHEPMLPEWLERVEVRDMAVGSSKVSLAFTHEGAATSFSLLHREGDIRIAIQA